MPYADADGCAIHYTRAGENPDAPAVVLLGELGFGAWQWSWQYGALAGPCRVVVDRHPRCRSVGRPRRPLHDGRSRR